MPRNAEGEYELVLGDRQLLSVFFIVVVLLGIGFTLGYILGRNSVAPASVTADTSVSQKGPEAVPPILPDPPQARTPESKKDTEPPKQIAAQKPAGDTSATKPFKTGPPPSGTVFIQVAAVGRADAEMEATSLSKQGFPTWVASHEKPELFSVLVGPFAEKADLAKAKASLEQLGFKKAFRKEIK